MSTQALREGAEVLRAQATYRGSPLYVLYLRMLAEVDAIERAAKGYMAVPRDMGAAVAFERLMESIARDAK